MDQFQRSRVIPHTNSKANLPPNLYLLFTSTAGWRSFVKPPANAPRADDIYSHCQHVMETYIHIHSRGIVLKHVEIID